MFEDRVRNWPFFQTPQRPPHMEVHTTGSPSQNSAVFGGALGGGTSPWPGAGGGGSALATMEPAPSTAADRPTATATADSVVLIKVIGGSSVGGGQVLSRHNHVTSSRSLRCIESRLPHVGKSSTLPDSPAILEFHICAGEMHHLTIR